jgi:anti-anti-sigma factor
MIRLSRQKGSDSPAVRLEGDLNTEVVDLVRDECRRSAAEAAPQRLLIDLRELRSADQAGLRLLRELMARPDVEVINFSPLWQTLIHDLPE